MRFFRHSIAASTLALIVAALSYAKSSPSFADEGIAELKTSSGLLVTREAVGSECGAAATFADRCTALFLNNKFILSEFHVAITKAYPSKADPQLVTIGTGTGGNACCWEDYIFDFTVKPPLKFKGGFSSKIAPMAAGVVFPMYEENDALGDSVVGTYSYKFGSGRLVKIREAAEYNNTPLPEKKTPNEIMADPVTRAPILKIVGTTYFAKFRQSIGLASAFTKIDGQFIVADGCQPHYCSGRYAMFVLDLSNKLSWAVEGTDDGGINELPRARVWGVLTPSDTVPMSEISKWLARHKVPEGRVTFVSLPDAVSRLYKQPRQLVAKADEPTTSSPPSAKLDKADGAVAPLVPQLNSTENSTIALEKEGGILVVPVVINGELTLSFTIDSGASDVSIPADVVLTLVRTGTLTDDDFLGTKTYRLADGSTVPSRTFRIRSLKVGDHVLKDVTGSVAPVAGALLLGQSFLSRFRSWSIDNQRRVLLLEQ